MMIALNSALVNDEDMPIVRRKLFGHIRRTERITIVFPVDGTSTRPDTLANCRKFGYVLPSMQSVIQFRKAAVIHSAAEFLRLIEGRIPIEPYTVQHSTRFARTVREIENLFSGNASRASVSVLDVGCHAGGFVVALKQLGFATHGVDLPQVIEEYRDRYEKNGVEVRSITDLQKLPYADGTFDCVVFAETLEHIYDYPLNILGELKRVLKPGGYLVLTTPNVMRLENKIKFLLNINIYQDLHRYVTSPRLMLHYHEYKKSELEKLLSQYAGMKIVRSTIFDNPGGRTPAKRLIQRLIYSINFLIPGFKGVLLAVAQKPG